MAETGAVLRGEEVVKRNIVAVRKAVEGHMFSSALEGALRLIVNEARNPTRPLAWTDVSGNLRASISFQIEHVKGPRALGGHHADGVPTMFNTVAYRSGRKPGNGEWGIVFAPPDYAIHVEAKTSRSVLLAPINTVRAKLRAEMEDGSEKAWKQLVLTRRAIRNIT
jgi:hypothetical protein